MNYNPSIPFFSFWSNDKLMKEQQQHSNVMRPYAKISDFYRFPFNGFYASRPYCFPGSFRRCHINHQNSSPYSTYCSSHSQLFNQNLNATLNHAVPSRTNSSKSFFLNLPRSFESSKAETKLSPCSSDSLKLDKSEETLCDVLKAANSSEQLNFSGGDLRELEKFAASFKSRRIRLGFTQTNVGTSIKNNLWLSFSWVIFLNVSFNLLLIIFLHFFF